MSLTNTARWLISASICAFFALALVMTVAELYGPAVALLSAGIVILVAAAASNWIWWAQMPGRRQLSPDPSGEASTPQGASTRASLSLMHLQRATSELGEEDISARSEREIAFLVMADRGRLMRMGEPQLVALDDVADEEETTLACLILRGSTVTIDRERFLL